MKKAGFKYVAPLLIGVLAHTPLLFADDITLDDKVQWKAIARQGALPSSIEVVPVNKAGEHEQGIVVQLRRIEYVISEETIEKSTTRVYRYLRSDGIRDYGNLRTFFNAASDTVEIHHAMVVDSGGTTHVVEPATVQILPTDTTNIFSDSKSIVMPLTGLDLGSTAIVTDKIVTARRSRIAPWGVSIYEQYGVPQERLELRVRWTSPDLRPEWNSEFENTSCTESSNHSILCVATDIPAYPDNPDVYYADVLPELVFAENKSWADIGRWYQTIFESALTADTSIVDTAKRLSDGLDSETQVLKAIHNFVAKEVRYVGLEHGSSAYVPHRTDLTLKRRYGDCKDKTALLIDLLNQVGINMSPVLVATDRRDPAGLTVPSSGYFDHLIVCGSLSNGKEYCLDSTDPNSGIASLSNWIQGAVALPVAGDIHPIALPADRFRWQIEEGLELTIAASGQLLESSQIDYVGVYGSTIRRVVSAMSDEERQKWALKDYHSTISDQVDPEFRFSGIDSINDSLSISWQADYGELLSSDEDLSYSENPGWLDQILSSLKSENDAYDYRFSGVQYNGTTTVNVDEHWQFDRTGPEIDMQSAFGSFRRSHEVTGQAVTVHTSIEVPAAVIAIADLTRFTRFLDVLLDENTIRIEAKLRKKGK